MAGGRRRELPARTLLICAVGLLVVAGVQFQVQGAEAEEDTMPVVDEARAVKDDTSRYASQKSTLNDEGDEHYIEHPDDEESLLKEALENEEPVESMKDDPEFEEKYQPTYEYDDDEEHPGAEGQDESDGLEAVMQSERAYFIARDHDGDGELSKEEFIRQLNDVDIDADDKGDWDSWNVSARGRPAPSKEELMWGKDWTARVSDEQADEAFNEYDVDKNGKVSWEEWQGIMFHEDHQIPEYRDGLEAVVDPLSDEDIDPEELEQIKQRFTQADADKDGALSLDEVHKLIIWSHDEPLYPDGVMNYTRPTNDELHEAADQLMKDYERDKKGGLTLDEWIQGGGF